MYLPTLNVKFVFLLSFFYYLIVCYYKGGLWQDELSLMSDILLSKTLPDLVKEFVYEVHAPGIWLITYGLAKLSLTSEFVVRLPGAFMAAVGVTAFVRLATPHLTRTWLWLFWFLMLSLPPLSWHASEVRPHIFLFGFGSIILLFLHEATLSSENLDFRKNLKLAFIVFAISVWFHFATFFMLIGVFTPFAILNRQRIFSVRLRFFGKYQIIFYLSTLAAAACATFLFYRNIQSVLWDQQTALYRFIEYTSSSLVFTSYMPFFTLSFVCVVMILMVLILNRISTPLNWLGFTYFWSLALFLLIEHFGYPLGRAKYSLYFNPVLTLMFLKYLSDLKINKLLTLIPIVFIGLNLKMGSYIKIPLTQEMIQKAQDFLNQNSSHKLVLFGYKRDIFYYLRNLKADSNQVIDCNSSPQCLVDLMQISNTDQVLILFYKTNIDTTLGPLMAFDTMMSDQFGRLVKIIEIKSNFKVTPENDPNR